jgi:tetratricopeptide (TPR) repeat protein
VLQSVSPASLPDERSRLEYQYRKARNHHEWGKARQAIEEYKNVIAEGRNQRYYFAANAALQLGLIYEKQNKPEEAILYYKECLSMDYDEYRSSISMKAKAGLNRLR